MTIKRTLQQIRQHGLTASWKPNTGKYRINYLGASEDTAYYTNDGTDAIATAEAMARNPLSKHETFQDQPHYAADRDEPAPVEGASHRSDADLLLLLAALSGFGRRIR